MLEPNVDASDKLVDLGYVSMHTTSDLWPLIYKTFFGLVKFSP